MKKSAIILFHVLFPIGLGVLIYLFFRGCHFLDPSEKYFPIIPLGNPEWFLYNLPDGLWLYALLASLFLVWKGSSSVFFHFWILFAVVASLATEIFQAMQFIPGTFDVWDMFAYIMAAMIFFVNFKTPGITFLTFKNY